MRGRGIPGSGPRWLLLASTLALLGVVVAARSGESASSPRAPTPSKAMPHGSVPSVTRTSAPRATRSTTSRPTTTEEGPSAGAASHASPGGTPSQTISIGPAPTTTTTTLSQSVSTSTTSPSTGQIEQGWLDGPTDVSAAYPRAATTGGVIKATWDTTATLTFSYSCPSGSDSITGTSGLVLTVPDGSCQIMIAGPTDVPQTEYSLDLGGT